MPDDRTRVLFCKYERNFPSHLAHRQRGGPRYEARVYDELLRGLGLTTLNSYGLRRDPSNGATFLALEYLDAPLRVNEVDVDVLADAAAWIGAFHATWESAPRRAPGFLFRYDLDYYCGWAERAELFARPLRHTYPWLTGVTSAFHGVAAKLVEQPATVIHGEFYPENVLYHAGRIYPVDWESAAIGPGEIDLAALTEKWDDEAVEQCVAAYRGARWTPSRPRERLLLDEARLYLSLRWLGHERAWTEDAGAAAIFDDVRVYATRLGIL
jgi:aminoglycoside phosphotransferase (APT) family kinase protein